MADEVNRFDQIQRALNKTCANLMRENAMFIERTTGAPSDRPSSYDLDIEACRKAMCSLGLIAGLARELFGEVDE